MWVKRVTYTVISLNRRCCNTYLLHVSSITQSTFVCVWIFSEQIGPLQAARDGEKKPQLFHNSYNSLFNNNNQYRLFPYQLHKFHGNKPLFRFPISTSREKTLIFRFICPSVSLFPILLTIELLNFLAFVYLLPPLPSTSSSHSFITNNYVINDRCTGVR